MPIIKSAIKKLRKDRKREKHNRGIKEAYKKAVITAVNKKTDETVRKAISLVNKAAKTRIIHKNKAARITSKLAKLVITSKVKARLLKKEKKPKSKVEKKPIKG